MNRKEYYASREGQFHLLMQRRLRRFHLRCDIRPKSHKKLLDQDKKAFEDQLRTELRSMNRKHYRSSVALKINIAVDKSNAPSAHKIPKAYIDLMYAETQKGLNRRPLLIKDDSQIKFLSVNYSIANFKPSISFEMARFKHLIDDLKMLDQISPNSKEQQTEDSFSHYQFNPEHYKDAFSEKTISAMKFCQRSDRQSDRLNVINFNFFMFKLLLSGYFEDDSSAAEFKKKLYEIQRNNILALSSCIDLGALPLEKGDSAEFKEKIHQSLKAQMDKFKISKPLLHQLSCTIIAIQPNPEIYHRKQKDLDNYALHYILPAVHKELSPQTTLENIYNRYYPLANEHPLGTGRALGLPESVIQYQILEIPRTESDDKKGSIHMFFGKGEYPSCCWQELDRRLDTLKQ